MNGPVTIGRYDWEMEASLAASRLASAGIPSWIPESAMGSICWHWGRALGGIRLQVGGGDAEDARAVLNEQAVAGEPIAGGNDILADRAARAAVFSGLAVPLLPYACWLLVRLWSSPGPLGPRARRQAALAAIAVLPMLGAIAALAVFHALQ